MRLRFSLLAGAVAAFAVSVAGCDYDSGASLPFDPSSAREIAREVLLDPDYLPGNYWSTGNEEFSGSTGGGAGDPFDFRAEGDCGPVAKLVADYRSSSIGKRAIEAKRELSRPGTGPAGLVTEVSAEMEIYREGADLADDMTFVRAIVESPEYEACMQETFSASAADIAGPGTKTSVVTKRAEPGALAPAGSAALAFDLQITAGATELQMRVEQYFWSTENAVLSLEVTGERVDVSHGVGQSAIDSLVRTAAKEAAATDGQ